MEFKKLKNTLYHFISQLVRRINNMTMPNVLLINIKACYSSFNFLIYFSYKTIYNYNCFT